MIVILGSLACVSLFVFFLATGCLARKTRQRFPSPERWEPISVLKPLKGVDEGLYENLVALARQDYPSFEILFGAEEGDDPALDVARRVQREFPGVPMRIVVGAADEGLNPKVRTLRRLLSFARHEWILVSDSNVRPDPWYLREIRACQESTGARLVHNLLVSVGEKSLGARLENLQMNGWVAASIAFCDAGGHPCVIGKSMLMSRASLDRVGGFEGVQDVLAEDYILGSKFTERGLRVELSPYVLPVVSGARDVSVFWNRHVRWGQMRRHIAPFFFFGELFVNPTPWLLLFACVAGRELAVLALLGLLGKWAVDAAVSVRLEGRFRPGTLVWLPAKDLLIPLMWLVSALQRRVLWRGHEMRIGAGSRLYPVSGETLELAPRPEESLLRA